jgi:uncharacterized protein (DUF1810 family)
VNDPFELSRYLVAQEAVYADVLSELRRGRKTGHWMWFVFPQLAGLGISETSIYYSISSIEEARAFLAHPVLGRRLMECTNLVLSIDETSAERIFGKTDAMKFRSSMTLFREAEGGEPAFQRALDRFFDGVPDARTVRMLQGA